MDSTKSRSTQRLQLEGISLNTGVAKKLPPRLAFNYHMIPLAIEKNCVTVAMADPENKFAIHAVKTALGATPYIVKSDQNWIDSYLAELWPDYQNTDLHLLFCTAKSDITAQFKEYSNYIQALFQVPESNIRTIVCVGNNLLNAVEELDEEPDLIILDESVSKRCLRSVLTSNIRTHRKQALSSSIWVIRQPVCPIQKILLVLGCENRDHLAVDWISKMALSSTGSVTMLVTLPPVPRMYQGLPELCLERIDLLPGKHALGEHLRSLAARLENRGIEMKIGILEGVARYTIQQEVMRGDYGLITVAADQHGWLRRRCVNNVVGPVLDYAACPMLIAKPLYR